jgi:hypothetical protein
MAVAGLDPLDESRVEFRGAGQDPWDADLGSASNVSDGVVAYNPGGGGVSSGLKCQPEGLGVGLFVAMLGRVDDGVNVVGKPELEDEVRQFRNVVAHDDVPPAGRARQPEGLEAVGKDMPASRFHERLAEPRGQARSLIRAHADPYHGVSDQREDRLPPILWIAKVVVHLLPVMPGETVVEELGDLLSCGPMTGCVLVEHFNHTGAPPPRPSRQGAVEVPQDDRNAHMPMLPQVGAVALADTERALAAVFEGRTVLAIAHRLHKVHDADRVAASHYVE